MKAGDIWAGHHYAYVEGRGRGENYNPSAQRVIVKKLDKRKPDAFAEKLSTFVIVDILNDDGSVKTGFNGQPMSDKEIRARDIMCFWHQFEDEREHRIVEAERIERDRQAQAEKSRARREAIMTGLEGRGIERTAVTISDYDNLVKINRRVVESWLGLDAQT